MGSFKLGGMTLGSLFKKPETVLYPFETKPAPAGLKGHIALDPDRCILCGICAKTCPAGALVVEKKERTWSLDPFRCVQCGSCVRACPKACLAMEPAYTPVATAQSCTVVPVPDPKAAVTES
ncbi:4Fe-4S binding protein [Adlercreutzia sp. R21]|uniref:4Fe-4S binding protein n=1 Tax=Adlercreutzia wanghongyangiae TaxID=3111451 RepID=A0ABU6IHH8_9ACTN|nr:4Fe-4S binding protein [Adlercreutzia sp. R21]MEC4175893.1 4Fe-4S binding protein [Adlercreutzia sp. R7]MEC4184134.1 4Fe-4S binding protein [Adlercreutzia sp. R21]